MAFQWSPFTPEQRLENGRAIGHGSFGWVEEVVDKSNRRKRALKVIRVTADRVESRAAEVQREVQIMRRVSGHPHIVEVLDAWKGRDRFSILLSPVAECDLSTFFGECVSTGFPTRMSFQAKMWFSCLVGGLAHIHSLRIRHKDIKPENILVKDGNVLFADFGLAKDFASLKENSTTEGPTPKTLIYAAPEAMTGGRRNYSADIYSLGCVFAEIATILSYRSVADFSDFRTVSYGDCSTRAFCRTQRLVFIWLDQSGLDVCNLIKGMLQDRSEDRPRLDEVQDHVAEIFADRFMCHHWHAKASGDVSEEALKQATEDPSLWRVSLDEAPEASAPWRWSKEYHRYYRYIMGADGKRTGQWAPPRLAN